VSKAFDKRERTVRRWRQQGVPKRYQEPLAKLAEMERPALPHTEEPLGDDDELMKALTGVGHDLASLPEPTAAPAERPDAPPVHLGPEDEAAPMPPDRLGEDHIASTEKETAPGTRQWRRHRRGRRHHATAADQPHTSGPRQQPGETRPGLERSARPSVSPKATLHEKKPVRLNRQTAIIAGAVLVSAIGIGLSRGLRQVSSTPTAVEREQERIYEPAANVFLPDFSYKTLTRPQPVAVGQAAVTVATDPPEKPAPEPTAPIVTPTQVTAPVRDLRAEEEEAALQSGLFPPGALALRPAPPAWCMSAADPVARSGRAHPRGAPPASSQTKLH